MFGPNFADEIDCGSFFDHIDDLLDFPSEDVDSGLPTGYCDAFPSIWSTPADSFPCSDSVFSGNSASDLSAELSVPYEDIVQLEWLSNFVEDSFSGKSLTISKEDSSLMNKDSSSSLHNFQTSSPISVLESSSSCSGGKTAPPPGKRGRARSKRPRPAMFNPRLPIQLVSDSENFAESQVKVPKQKKKIKLSIPVSPSSTVEATQSVRKCKHCEITKTPQWRAGPLGPKTLCNACGVRYKSGRLFPEYRPAASPTFVPSLHSNSHKKVTEMRNIMIGNEPPELAPDSKIC